MTTARCPFCGALLDVAWSRAHAPHCPQYHPETEPTEPTTTPRPDEGRTGRPNR